MTRATEAVVVTHLAAVERWHRWEAVRQRLPIEHRWPSQRMPRLDLELVDGELVIRHDRPVCPTTMARGQGA